MKRRLTFSIAAAIAACLVVLVGGPGTASAAQCKGGDSPAYKTSDRKTEKSTLCLINRQRASRGLHALRSERHQVESASLHNRLMIRRGCFSHLCPGEKDLVGRATAAGYLPCSCSWMVAENIAWGPGSVSSPRKIVDLWMHSPPHREAILNPRFEDIGVAVDRGSPESRHRDAATYTTDFGFKD